MCATYVWVRLTPSAPSAPLEPGDKSEVEGNKTHLP